MTMGRKQPTPPPDARSKPAPPPAPPQAIDRLEAALSAMTQELDAAEKERVRLDRLTTYQCEAYLKLEDEKDAAEQSLAEARGALGSLKESTLPALRVSLETEILPGIVASAQVWEAQRAERAVRTLIDAIPPPRLDGSND